MRTYSPKVNEITREWHLIDADGLILGRLATVAASLLRGKHRPYFAPHVDTGDYIVIVNADKIVVTANKAAQNFQYRHSGYPGGLRSTSWQKLMDEDPAKLVFDAIKGMVPRNRLGRAQMDKLFVYAGSEHPHAAQAPQPYDTSAIRRA
ncbi:MAG TPA: 50S ribosomal protein L13 [Acidimicrobiales bacterium]|nr:MAG: 50S ribosomal protein L13 [Actinobacteria bacterium 21-64-8]HQT99579.1 50S ribosomal protein L13 [Acidimicrobiales bacterium]